MAAFLLLHLKVAHAFLAATGMVEVTVKEDVVNWLQAVQVLVQVLELLIPQFHNLSRTAREWREKPVRRITVAAGLVELALPKQAKE